MYKKAMIAAVAGLAIFVSDDVGATEKLTIGNAKTVVRTVTGEIDKDLRRIQLLDDIYHNELIETKESSATELIFLDETKLALGPKSSLVLDRFIYDPHPDKASFVMTATAGVFRFVSGKLPKKSYEIHTPTATIGIRGTVFSIVVIPADRSNGKAAVVNITVEDGIADITSCDGQQLSLSQPGSSTTITETTEGACSMPTALDAQPETFASLLRRGMSAKQ